MVQTKYSRMAGGLAHAKQLGIALGLVLVALICTGVLAVAAMTLTDRTELSLYATFVVTVAGYALVAVVYLLASGRGLGYVDVSVPAPRSVALGVGLGVLVFAVQGALDGAARLAGVPMGTDQIAQQAAADPALLAGAIVVNLLLVAPAEELFFRNVLQKRLTERYTAVVGIAVVSLVFAPLHVGNFGGESTVAVLVSLVGVFLASVLYGVAFARWRELELVAVAHGVQNSVVFLVVYVAF